MLLEGPLQEWEHTLTLANLRQHHNWSLNDLSFELPQSIVASIDSIYFPQYANSVDHITWGLTIQALSQLGLVSQHLGTQPT